jgi:hypothetical protein
MRASKVVATAAELLKNDPAALLCDGGCEVCAEARHLL